MPKGHYNQTIHNQHMKFAFTFYYQNARGVFSSIFSHHLYQSIFLYFNLHRQCDKESLTGQSCLLPFNHLNRDLNRDLEGDLEGDFDGKQHCSGVTSLHSCNCGENQSIRPDPFSLFVLLSFSFFFIIFIYLFLIFFLFFIFFFHYFLCFYFLILFIIIIFIFIHII